MRSGNAAIWGSLVLWLLLGASPIPSPAAIIVFNDGATHTVSDASLAGNTIQVFDSASLQTTTLQVVDGGNLTRDPVYDWSVQLIPGAGRSRLEMLGGSVDWKVQVAAGGCVDMSGGALAHLSGEDTAAALWLDGVSGPAVAEISGSAAVSGLNVRRNGIVRITGGIVIDLPGGTSSLDAQGTPSSRASVTITGGTVQGMLTTNAGVILDGGNVEERILALSGSHVDIVSGTLIDGLHCIGSCKGRVSGGTFGGSAAQGMASIFINTGASVTVTGGSFASYIRVEQSEFKLTGGAIADVVNINLFSSSGRSKVSITGGSVDQGVEINRLGSVRISGGSIGASATNSVAVGGGQVEVFGGTFGAPVLSVGADSSIRFFGTGLNLQQGQVSGTLADGTPINVAYTEALGGRVYVNNQYSEQVSSGFWPGLKIRRARLQLPPGLRPSPTDCNAGVQPAVAVDFDQIPNGELLIEGMEIATDPGDIPHQDAIPIEIRQFGLQSVEPVLGTSGVEQMLFYTLQSERGVSALDPPPGPVSTGTATIDFAMRSFTLETELFYDIRGGAEDGPILSSGSDSLMTTEPVPWSPVDASGAFAAGPDDPFSPGEAAGGFFSIELEGSDFDLAVGQPEPAVAIPILGTFGHAVLALLVSGVGFARARRSGSDHSR